EKQKLIPKKIKKNKVKKYNKLKLSFVSKYCDINKKSSIPQAQMELGNTPYVTTSSKNNGISSFVDEEPIFKGKCLTIALNGSVCETFFQFEDFITSGDNAVLTLKSKYNPYLLFYISVMIRKHKWKFNYYRKLNLPKLYKMQIPMPFNNKSELDLSYIESVVKNSFGFNKLKQHL
ncbi:MAG: restriction endonuclease subunit S, partial [Melioribacteraceae bacterium]